MYDNKLYDLNTAYKYDEDEIFIDPIKFLKNSQHRLEIWLILISKNISTNDVVKSPCIVRLK